MRQGILAGVGAGATPATSMQFYMNRRVNRAIGCSPFKAMFGRWPAADIDRKMGATQGAADAQVRDTATKILDLERHAGGQHLIFILR